MKKQFLNVLLTVILLLNASIVSAQKAQCKFDIITHSDDVIRNAEIAKGDETSYMLAVVTHLPDLSKYDLVVATLSFKGIKKVVGYYQLSGKAMWASTKTSTKIAGMKYLQFAVVDAKSKTKAGEFTIDAFPFEAFDIPYLFSKEGNKNLDSFIMELSLDGRMITGYEDKWENDTHKRVPVYGNFINIAEPAQITIQTSANIAPKPLNKAVNKPSTLLDAINAGNKKIEELK